MHCRATEEILELIKMQVHAHSITSLSATELASLIRQKQISPVEVIDDYLQRIEELNPSLNAFAMVNQEQARREARRAEMVLNGEKETKPLLGAPVTIKSCIDVQGMLCEAGSNLRSGYVAAEDAALVRRLKQAGAIVIGNTTAPEMLLAYHTENNLQGRTNNPWALERTPGGSSGGEAAAIAACMSAGGIGSDGGGSIRVPAHFSGICGLKPTPGRIPGTGHFPECAGPFALIGVVGPMARTVADLKILFEIMQGPDDGDTCAGPVPLRWRAKDELKRLRIGYFDEDGRTPVAPEVRQAVRTAADVLSRAGFQVEPFRPEGLEEARVLWKKFFVKMGGMLIGPMFDGREHDVSPIMREFLQWSAAEPELSAASLLDAWIQRDSLRASFLAQMQTYPIL